MYESYAKACARTADLASVIGTTTGYGAHYEKEIKDEIAMLSLNRHQNVVALYEAFLTEEAGGHLPCPRFSCQ